LAPEVITGGCEKPIDCWPIFVPTSLTLPYNIEKHPSRSQRPFLIAPLAIFTFLMSQFSLSCEYCHKAARVSAPNLV
jgi:hypothetical protein